MHLGITIPLKSKLISKDWDTTCRALYGTLGSLQNQTCKDFSVIVVGHDEPAELTERFPWVHFKSVSFDAPDRSATDFSHMMLVRDKNLKIIVGMKKLKDIIGTKIDYWYQLDSDDLVRNDFIKLVKQVEGRQGAVLDGGYFIFGSCKRYVKTEEMSQYCGSTSILADDSLVLPDDVDEESIKQVPWASYPHKNMKAFFINILASDYIVIDSHLVGYVLSSGDNISDNWRNSFVSRISHFVKPYIKGKRLDRGFKSQFGIN